MNEPGVGSIYAVRQLIRHERIDNLFHLQREVGPGDSDGAAKRDDFHHVHAALARLTFGNVRLRLLQTLRHRSLRQSGPFARLDEQAQKRLVFGRVPGCGLGDNVHPPHAQGKRGPQRLKSLVGDPRVGSRPCFWENSSLFLKKKAVS